MQKHVKSNAQLSLIGQFHTFVKLWRRSKNKISFLEAIRYFPHWKRSLEGSTPLEDAKPWIVFNAFEFLDQIIDRNMIVFEYGAGGSSAYFSSRVRKVFSVEHDAEWLEKASEKIQKNNWEGIFIDPTSDPSFTPEQIAEPGKYFSAIDIFAGKSFKNYASSIDRFDDESFDLVFIDGRARNSCLLHAKNKVRKGGYLALDNSERKRYSFFDQQLTENNWRKREYFGPGPYVSHEFWGTTFWQRK